MNVFILQRRGHLRPTFLAEAVDEAADGPKAPARPRPEDRSRFARTVRDLKAMLWTAGRRSGPIGRKALSWLSRRREPDEPLLRALRSSSSLELHHPSRMKPRHACREWHHYLGRRRNTHLIRALIDLALAAVSLPLMLLPGPNVVGFWFLWRAGMHGMIVLGTRRALRDDPAPVLVPRDELNERIDVHDPDAVERMGSMLGVADLATLLRKHDRKPVEPHVEPEDDPSRENER